MGEMAEYYMNRELDWMIFDDYAPIERKRIIWITSDGRELEPKYMTDSHLLNCLHLCERRGGHRGINFLNLAPTYRAMVSELVKRDRLTNSYFKMSIDERMSVRLE